MSAPPLRSSARSFALLCLLVARLQAGAGAGRLPGQTLANDKGGNLPFTLTNQLLQIEHHLNPACSYPRIADTFIVGEPRRSSGVRNMQWTERWTIDRCGAHVDYLIHFDYRGSVGTFKIEPPKA